MSTAATSTSTSTQPTPFPTAAALGLEQMSFRALDGVFMRGLRPELPSLAGWEFRGLNRLPLNSIPFGTLVGIKKFVKGFHTAEDGRLMGYNSPVVMNAIDGRWRTKPSDEAPKRFGFYQVAAVDATAHDNKYLHAVLLDYGKGGNPRLDITAGLRDYLVQVDGDNPDLYLGKAYYAFGPARVHLNYFILERFRRSALASA